MVFNQNVHILYDNKASEDAFLAAICDHYAAGTNCLTFSESVDSRLSLEAGLSRGDLSEPEGRFLEAWLPTVAANRGVAVRTRRTDQSSMA